MTTGSILWLVAIGAFFYFMMKNGGGCCGGHDHGDHGHGADERSGLDHGGHSGQLDDHRGERSKILLEGRGDKPAELKDPVCGMEVNGDSASPSSEYMGKTFHFCSDRCRKLFDLHPNRYTVPANV